MPFIRRAFGAATVATLALSLAACSGGNDDVETPKAPSASPSAMASEAAPSPSETAKPSTNTSGGDVAAPGANVSMNEPFVIPSYEAVLNDDFEITENIEHSLELTFDGIRPGSVDDFAETLSSDNLATLADYDILYFDYTATQVDGWPMEAGRTLSWSDSDLRFKDNAGNKVSGIIISFTGGPEQCETMLSRTLQEEGTDSGCVVLVVPKGNTFASAEYEGFYVKDQVSPYKEAPAVWTYEG